MINQFKGKYQFLSNFYRAKIIIDDKEYGTTEHYFQSMKFRELDLQEKVRTAATPALAKKLARQMKAHIRYDWIDVSFYIMEKALKEKFAIPELREKLLATGEMELQEGNTWNDRFWGVDLKTGEGDNHLGKLLMKIRGEIRKSHTEGKI